jgi:hypothetical protein
MLEIVILEHLSYITSSIAETCTGEAKAQIQRLTMGIEKATDIEPEVRERVLGGLRAAQVALMDFRAKEGAIELWRITEFLWNRVIPEGVGDRFEARLPGPWAKFIKPGDKITIIWPPEIQAMMDQKPRDD